MFSAEFKPVIPGIKQYQTTLGHTATGINIYIIYVGCAMAEAVRHWPVTVYAQF